MILYLDASALVKLYVEEPGSEAVAARLERAEAAVTVRVTYAEARAAFARHRREGGLTVPALRRVVRQLDGEWGTYNVVDDLEFACFDDRLARAASRERLPLAAR